MSIKILRNVNPAWVKILSIVIIFLAISLAFFTRIIAVFTYNQFDGDQARDSFVYAKMAEGSFPKLGPGSSVGGYFLPPLYYYLTFAFSFWTKDPVWQAFPNAFFSFLSIPVFIYFIYVLLENINASKRLLLSSIAGLWWSLFFNDVLLNNMEWNPNSIPFFILIWVLLFNKLVNTKINLLSLFGWFIYGTLVGILVSLHSTTMFVIPIIFIGSLLYFIVKNKNWNSFLVTVLSILGSFLSLLPYWVGEIKNNWSNTLVIIDTVFKPSTENHDFLTRIDRAIFNYSELGNLAYFLSENIGNISGVFMAGILCAAILKFKGNKLVWEMLLSIWLVYGYATSNYWGTFFIHYKILIWFAPIIFAIICLAYSEFEFKISSVFSVFVVAGICLSISTNALATYNYLGGKYGESRTVNTNDIAKAFKQIPEKSTVCTTIDKIESYKYLDKYLSKNKLNFKLECEQNDIILYPKYTRTDNFNVVLNLNEPPKGLIIFEDSVLTLIKL